MTKKSQQPPMVHRLPITKARINLGAVIKQVHLNKEYVILEKDGIPVAAVMDVEEFEDYLELQNPDVKRHIAESRKEYLAGKSRPADTLLAELEAGAKREKPLRARRVGTQRKKA